MRALKFAGFLLFLLAAVRGADPIVRGSTGIAQDIPKTWDDGEIARHEVPLADPSGSPKHVSSDYYYRIPVRPIYKGYPVYAPGHEPPGYMEWLKQQEPVIVWNDGGHAPALQIEQPSPEGEGFWVD